MTTATIVTAAVDTGDFSSTVEEPRSLPKPAPLSDDHMKKPFHSLVGTLLFAALSVVSLGTAIGVEKREISTPESETSFRYGIALGQRYQSAASANSLLSLLGRSDVNDLSIVIIIDTTIIAQNYHADPVIAGRLPLEWIDAIGLSNEIKYMDAIIKQRSESKRVSNDPESEKGIQEAIASYAKWKEQITALKVGTKTR